jgi:hypothetical protein
MSAARAAAALQANSDLTATLAELTRYETARSGGSHGLTSHAQPSNPRSFFRPPVKTPARASSVVNAVMLAGAIGMTEGDRRFLAEALAEAAKRVNTPKVSAASLGRAVFEGPEFADLLDGEPLPDRDEFKDRFVAGLDSLLKSQYPATNGYVINRSDYASGPRYDAKAYREKETAIVPTSACLRCHEVRASGKSRQLEPIPALAFDPFDKPGREAWLKTADRQRRLTVLGRMQQRLATDKDMPPEDAPEYDRFRINEEVAFEEVTRFLKAELGKLK